MSDFVTNVQLHILLFTDYTEMKIAVREAHDYAEWNSEYDLWTTKFYKVNSPAQTVISCLKNT